MTRGVVFLAIALLLSPASALAQAPPPPIPLVVFHVHANFPHFPQNVALADSRGMVLSELPGRGFGGQAGVQIHFFRFKAITFGAGGQAIMTRATQTPSEAAADQIRPVTEKFRSLSGQLSLNF